MPHTHARTFAVGSRFNFCTFRDSLHSRTQRNKYSGTKTVMDVRDVRQLINTLRNARRRAIFYLGQRPEKIAKTTTLYYKRPIIVTKRDRRARGAPLAPFLHATTSCITKFFCRSPTKGGTSATKHPARWCVLLQTRGPACIPYNR